MKSSVFLIGLVCALAASHTAMGAMAIVEEVRVCPAEGFSAMGVVPAWDVFADCGGVDSGRFEISLHPGLGGLRRNTYFLNLGSILSAATPSGWPMPGKTINEFIPAFKGWINPVGVLSRIGISSL